MYMYVWRDDRRSLVVGPALNDAEYLWHNTWSHMWR